MTDADDAGLVQRMRIVTTLPSRLRSQDDIDEKLLVAADRIEYQRREIEDLRRERDEAIVIAARYEERANNLIFNGIEARERAEKVEASLAEGVNHIQALMEAGPERYAAAYKAASAFATKHGGRDG